ncbi:MAG: flagellar protein FlgN [Gammaproteobacteria bacterium]|nr:flagellar protein FlgN [Gammaproteobacteria bacterium]
MPERAEIIERLPQQLAQELELLRQFYDVLMEEHDILEQRKTEHLDETTKRKQDLLDEFQGAVSERMALLEPINEDAQSVMSELAKQHSDIGGPWEELQQLLEQCKEQNIINGAIIEVSQHNLQIALSILTERTASTELYDAKGKTRHGDGSGSSLAKA